MLLEPAAACDPVAGQQRHPSTSDEYTTTDHRRPHLLAEGRRCSLDVAIRSKNLRERPGNDLTRRSREWALDHWDEVAPELLGIWERFASGVDRSDEAARAIFVLLHLAGERQDTRVFPLLCRLARDGEAFEVEQGDDITTTLTPILISIYDGDLDTLKGVIEAAEADEFVRAGALEVLAYLTAIKRIPREQTEAYLLQLYDTLQPQHESFVWSGWVLAIALLGLEGLRCCPPSVRARSDRTHGDGLQRLSPGSPTNPG